MIWNYQDVIARRLLLWSAASACAGAILVVAGGPFWRGFGVQALVWGLIDAMIALVGRIAAARRRAASDPGPQAHRREAAALRRLLWINTCLDVLYVTGGLIVAYALGRESPFAAGNGWGVVVQGAFLLVFDLLHARAVPLEDPGLPSFAVFDAPEHLPFTLDGGRPAALVVHGFGGTPAEMRPLAASLSRAGWTVHAPLLPGFGPQTPTLGERTHDEWLAAVRDAAHTLRNGGHDPLLLVGFSIGGALSILAASTIDAAGLVLLAPFHRREPAWLRPLEFVARPFLSGWYRPLHRADFAIPQLRRTLGHLMPDLDLDDPATQDSLRAFRVPLILIDELRALSRRAYAAAAHVDAPVLMVQGLHDVVVLPGDARRLAGRFPQPPHLVEVDTDHDLLSPDGPAWPQVERELAAFQAKIRQAMEAAAADGG